MRVQLGELVDVEEYLLNCVDNQHPDSALILETLAGAYMRNLRYVPALSALNRWVEVAPHSALAHQQRGWLLDRAMDHQGALADYRRAVELAADLVPARLRLAELLLQENEVAEAAGHLELLHSRHPDRADVTARLGQCRFQQGRADEARRLLEAAEARLPDDPFLLIHLAKLDLQDSDPARAERRVRHLLAVDPADAEGQYVLIQVLRQQGKRDEAEACQGRYRDTQALLRRVNVLLRDEVERSPSDPATPSEAGMGLLRLGQDRLALYWLHEALRRDPDHQPSHRALADYYQRKGNQAKAAVHRRRLTGPAAEASGP
jgi:Tfp pilus assembly protein PilF